MNCSNVDFVIENIHKSMLIHIHLQLINIIQI
jgi:hypothetical protein